MTVRILGLALLVGLVLPALFVIGVRQRADPAPTPPPSRMLPDFSLDDQDGRLVRSTDLRGVPVVVTFFFTSCTSICPISTAHLVRLQQAIATEDVAFVSFSIDPDRDGRAARRDYANRWAPQERRWHLLAPSAAQLAEVATSLGLKAGSTADVHTTSMVLLAPGGRVYRTWSPETPLADEVAAVYSLLHSPETAGQEQGPDLYQRFGCGGCHHDANIAPDLSRSRPRTAEQLRQDLVAPGVEIAPGYLDTMPSYADVLSDRQLGALGIWLSTYPAGTASTSTGQADAPATAVDPVCGMAVNPSDSVPHASIGGTEHWFCSEFCRQAYLEAPDRYDQ